MVSFVSKSILVYVSLPSILQCLQPIHVRQNAEEFRSVFVDFGGEMDLCIQTAEELDSKTLDWASLFEQFYHQINQQANSEIKLVRTNS